MVISTRECAILLDTQSLNQEELYKVHTFLVWFKAASEEERQKVFDMLTVGQIEEKSK